MRVLTTGNPPCGEIELPGSKSESNRLLMIQAYSGNAISIEGVSEADDTILLNHLLNAIRTGNRQESPVVIDCNNAGTVLRFLLTFLSLQKGKWMLTGRERMKKRPVGDLVQTLRTLGADIQYTEQQGYPPLVIKGKELIGGEAMLNASVSSQFASSLLLAAPCLERGIKLSLNNEISSQPYIGLTIDLMRLCGAEVRQEGTGFIVDPEPYKSCNQIVSRDWSSAAFWYQMIAIARKGALLLNGLDSNSMQGDRVLMEMFRPLGVSSVQESGGIRIQASGKAVRQADFDFTHHPDLFPAVASTCAALGVDAVFCGTRSLRIKESDRISAMAAELSKTGSFLTESDPNSCRLIGDTSFKVNSPIHFESWDDHRIAMALAPLALQAGEITISHPEVVSKSYPGFWKQLEATGSLKCETID